MQGLGEDEEQRHKKLYNKKKGKNKVVWLIVKNKIKKKTREKSVGNTEEGEISTS